VSIGLNINPEPSGTKEKIWQKQKRPPPPPKKVEQKNLAYKKYL